MIIVEGCDGAGKTRLILRLMESLRAGVEPRAVDSDQNMLTDIQEWVVGHINSWPRRALYDRFALISGPIYAPVMETMHVQEYLKNDIWMVEWLREFREKKPVIIFCDPGLDEVLKNTQDEYQPPQVKARAEVLYWLYRMEACRWPTSLIWDYRNSNYDRLLVNINNKLRDANVQY